MKEDTPTPLAIPKKRRQLEAALDRWIAEWLARSNLALGDRKRLEEEKERRKGVRKSPEKPTLGILHAREGMTPEQRRALNEYRLEVQAGRDVTSGDFKAVVRLSDTLFAAPNHARQPASGEDGVWSAIRYARHRKVPVKIVLPNGEELK